MVLGHLRHLAGRARQRLGESGGMGAGRRRTGGVERRRGRGACHWPTPSGSSASTERCAGGVTRQDVLRRECQFLPHEAGWYGWASSPIRRAQIQEQQKTGEYLVVDTTQALVALVQGDILEIHVWNSNLDHLEQPDRIVFDLDPGDGVRWTQVVAAAIQIREIVASLGLRCWPKLTGGKGVHVVIPFEPQHGWDAVYALAHRLAQAAFRRDPHTLTLDFAKQKRAHRILVDYKRNHRGAVAVAAFSARARPSGPVGIPLSWRQLQASRGSDQWTSGPVDGGRRTD